MKHQHDHVVKVDILDAAVDAEKLVDKITESVVIIIVASTTAHIIKSFFKIKEN